MQRVGLCGWREEEGRKTGPLRSPLGHLLDTVVVCPSSRGFSPCGVDGIDSCFCQVGTGDMAAILSAWKARL